MRLSTAINKQDFLWGDIGDLIIENGDIKDSRLDGASGFLDEVKIRVSSSVGDWKLSPEKGASLPFFEGRTNNEKTRSEIITSITESLLAGGFLHARQFNVSVIPISEDEIAIRVDFSRELSILIDEEIDGIKLVYSLSSNMPLIMR